MPGFPVLPPQPVQGRRRITQRGVVSQTLREQNFAEGGIVNPNIQSTARSKTAIVSTESKRNRGDFLDIQDAIDSVSDLGGGVIFIKSGTYFPPDKIDIPSNIQIVGEDSTNTIVDFSSASFSIPIFASIQAIGSTISSAGTIAIVNGSSSVAGTSTTFSDDNVAENHTFFINDVPYTVKAVASNTALTIKEIFRGEDVSGQTTKIENNVKNVSIRDITAKNSTKDGIKLLRVIKGAVRFCTVTKCEKGIITDGYQIENSFNSSFNNDNSASAGGISASGKAVSVFSNYVANNRGSGISISGNRVIVANNIVSNNDVNGLLTTLTTQIIISGNVFEGNDNAGIIFGAGSTRSTIIGNLCLNNATDGILISGTVGNPTNSIMITGNVTAGNGDDGLELTTNTTDCVVTNNAFAQGITDNGANTVANNV